MRDAIIGLVCLCSMFKSACFVELFFHQSHVEVQVESTELKPAVIKRTLPVNAATLEKEKAEIPDAKRCKIQRDVRQSVDKAIYDNFRSLNGYQIYV